ncbi:mycothiol transferase [Aeromicrobium sp.]|uniref:mycothiol transferase n=1 Tax=Aeromicrobium sp. TaxID=1871063 RepID=UPI003C4ADB86
MSDNPTIAMLTDAFGRVRGLVQRLTDGLDDPVATFRVDDEANTPAWLLWHLSRIQDDHVADLAGVEQAWTSWRDRFDLPLPAGDTGFGHGPEEVASVRADAALLDGYHADVHALTLRYVEQLTDDELARVVDTRWDPPVTASARLVSVLGDCWQHLGQAAYVIGMAQRAG